MNPRLTGLVAALTLVVAGCSGGDGDSDGGETRAPSPDPPSSSTAAAPELGAWHELVTDPHGGVLLVNGYPEDAPDPGPVELWRWDGQRWAAVEPADAAPTGRNFAAVAVDTARELLLLHGGLTADGVSDETWAWDGTSWSLVASGSEGPGPRSAPSMAYDAAAGRTLLYGGDDGTDQLGDTWSWDGRAWSRVAADGPGPVRWPALLEYDPTTASVVMFGGHQVADEEAPPAVGDTWVWDRDRWRPVPAADQPGPLVNANGVAHPVRGLLLVAGADARGDETGRMWSWTGTAWAPVPDDSAELVPARQAFGLAYDPERDVVVMTGGVVEPGSTERHQDLWEWSGDPRDPAVQVPADE